MAQMRVSGSVAAVRRTVAEWRDQGERVGFVPTMGALHEGHLSLVRRAGELADRVVTSIFVNPTQFGPEEDLERYPRAPEEDEAQLAGAGCELLFLPTVATVYPSGHATFVEPGGAAEGLEGVCRSGHFRGVATVVTQLFGIVQPDVAVFGRKDAQQLAVVRQLVRDLHLLVRVEAVDTVREADGLALSSRNRYLAPDERSAATVLWRALEAAAALVADGERDAQRVRERMTEILAREPLAVVDYAEVVDTITFRPVAVIAGPVTLPIAVTVGGTRLIDNLSLTPGGANASPAPASGAAMRSNP